MCESSWMPNLVNVADMVTPPILNPESVSRYGGLYEVERCHAAATRQRIDNDGVFFELLASADSEALHGSFHYSECYHGLFHITNFIQFIRFSFE